MKKVNQLSDLLDDIKWAYCHNCGIKLYGLDANAIVKASIDSGLAKGLSSEDLYCNLYTNRILDELHYNLQNDQYEYIEQLDCLYSKNNNFMIYGYDVFNDWFAER